ncbi:MAG: flagellar motor stator protein MotA [Venatoribacter sp.]
MLFIVGMIVVFASVGAGFVMSHGNLIALWQPYELLIICGAAFGAFVVANSGTVIKQTFGMFPKLITGGKVDKAMYLDLLGLLHDILNKARREGFMAIEADVESPESSALFARYPAIQSDHELSNFIADYFRIIAAGNLTSFELEGLMDSEIETRLHELMAPSEALSKVADAMPGFGIVAAVLGIVITMGAIDGEVSEIGGHVAAALVGTFAGVLFAYGVFAPISASMAHLASEEIKLYEVVKACILASLNGLPPQLAVEFGRKTLHTHGRPTFTEVESKVRGR